MRTRLNVPLAIVYSSFFLYTYNTLPLCDSVLVSQFVCTSGRVEVLRPFLTRLGLFPPRRNPESAPIRMEELRALVRKWNLHHKRNFWRENPSKDDVVAALNRHIRHMKVVHDNIENKKAERREADRKRLVQNSAGGEGNNPPRMASLKVRPPLESVSDTCLYSEGVPLRGLPRQVDAIAPADCVETGIIYMSRWGQEGTNNGEEPASGRTEQAATREDFGQTSASPQLTETRDDRNPGDLLGSKNTASKMQAQRKCSLALLNMTMRDQVLNRTSCRGPWMLRTRAHFCSSTPCLSCISLPLVSCFLSTALRCR